MSVTNEDIYQIKKAAKQTIYNPNSIAKTTIKETTSNTSLPLNPLETVNEGAVKVWTPPSPPSFTVCGERE